MMLGGNTGRRNVLNLLADPEALKASIDAHNKASEARLKSAEEYKKAKDEAQESIKHLDLKLAAHSDYERQLDARQKALDDLSGKLNDQISDYNKKSKELDEAVSRLDAEQRAHLQNIQQTRLHITQKEMQLTQQANELNERSAEVIRRHEELSHRESIIKQREAEIVEFADRLRGTN